MESKVPTRRHTEVSTPTPIGGSRSESQIGGMRVTLWIGAAYFAGLWAYPLVLRLFGAPKVDIQYLSQHGTAFAMDAVFARMPALVVILIALRHKDWRLRELLVGERRLHLMLAALATVAVSLLLDAFGIYAFSWRWGDPARIVPIQLMARSGNIVGIAIGLAVTTILTPLIEELVFRGGILQSIRRATGSNSIAVAGSAVLFSAAHAGAIYSSPFARVAALSWLFVVGLILSSITVRRRGRVAIPIAIHAARNLTESTYLIVLALLL